MLFNLKDSEETDFHTFRIIGGHAVNVKKNTEFLKVKQVCLRWREEKKDAI